MKAPNWMTADVVLTRMKRGAVLYRMNPGHNQGGWKWWIEPKGEEVNDETASQLVSSQAIDKRARGLFTEHPPARIWILADRPSCPPGEYLAAGNKAAKSKTESRAPTQLGWLR